MRTERLKHIESCRVMTVANMLRNCLALLFSLIVFVLFVVIVFGARLRFCEAEGLKPIACFYGQPI